MAYPFVADGAEMRVLYDHQIFSYQTFGGASRYFAELMHAFHRDGGPPFELGVAESPNEYLRNAPFYRGKTIARRSTAGFLRTFARNELQTWQLARRDAHDVMHATFYDPLVVRAIRGAKLVVTMLDMTPERYPEHFDLDSLYGRFVTRRWIEGRRMLCQRADAILAISENTKRDVVEFYGIDPARITVTHLGNNLTGGTDRPRLAGLPERYLLYVGTRNTYKNFAFFLEAAAPVLREDRELQILCVGGGAFTKAEMELVARHGLSGRITQRNVADHELVSCYAHAAVFVFPSIYEGFGIPIVEAFACGCPTLLADASCFPEIAGEAAVFFDPKDRGDLTTALRRVLGDPALARALRDKGLVRARAFTWDETARKTLAAYTAVTA